MLGMCVQIDEDIFVCFFAFVLSICMRSCEL